ncbi:hypothetical protein ABIE51_001418 [Lysobacter sp. OAE881]|uniref:hypothetical protein n=1 Tax=Lysobacter sp. OAE881 TaxID=2663813 RepID=UPI00178A2862
MNAHPHAEHMAEYAKDAAEMTNPWVLWEICRGELDSNWQPVWEPLYGNPEWRLGFKYRRKEQPAEFWVNFYEDGRRIIHSRHSSAISAAEADPYPIKRTAVHMREVTA